MATMALTIGGAALGSMIPGLGTIGGMAAGAWIGGLVGGVAGSYVDSQLLMPALSGAKGLEQGRIKDLELTGAEEGIPIRRCFGPECRVPGQTIFLSNLIETAREEGAGKGGSAQSVTKYQYFVDVAVALCEGEISAVKKIWADGKLLWQDTEQVDVVSTLISARQGTLRQLPASGVIVETRFVEFSSAPAGPDLQQFRSGNSITVSGFQQSAYNGNFQIEGTRRLGDGTTEIQCSKIYLGSPVDTTGLVAQPEAAGSTISISQTPEKFSKSRMDSVTFYTGSGTQVADTTIESYEGSGNVPGYRHIAYCVIKRIALEYYGNRLPMFSFQVEADASLPVPDLIGELCERTGLTSSDYDVSLLDDSELVRGYVISGLQPGDEVLQPVLIAYDILMQESSGVLRFFPRGSLTPRVVSADDLAAHEAGAEKPSRPLVITDAAEHNMPSEVSVQFIDPKLDYQRGSAREPKDDALFENPSSHDLPLVMEMDTARKIAGKMLWNAWNNRQSVELTLPPSYLELEEGDTVQVTVGSRVYEIVIAEIVRGHNWLHTIRGQVEDSFEYSPPGEDPAAFLRKVAVATPVVLHLIDIAPLRDAEKLIPGFYFAVGDADRAEGWNGALVQASSDGDLFTPGEIIRRAAVMGKAGLSVTEVEEIIDSASMSGDGSWATVEDDTAYCGSYRRSYLKGASINAAFTSGADTYDVFIRWTYATDRSDSVTVKVWTGAAWQYRYVDQADPDSSHRWVHIGKFTFTAAPYVQIVQARASLAPLGHSVPQGATTSVCIDAVKILKSSGTGVLGDGPVGRWDRENTIRVQLDSGTLESRTELEVLNGANHAVVGEEIIAFQTATLVDSYTYDLSTLLRGLRGTEGVTALHRGTERFIMLDNAGLHFLSMNAEDIGKVHYVKAVAPGQVADDVDPIEVLLRGNTLKHFAPGDLRAYLFVDSVFGLGLRVQWQHRTRAVVRVFNKAPWGIPNLDLAGYRIQIRNVNGLLMRIVATGTGEFNSWHYDNTLQAADGFSASDTIQFWVQAFDSDGRYGHVAKVSATSTL